MTETTAIAESPGGLARPKGAAWPSSGWPRPWLYAPLRKRLEELVDPRFKYDERRFGAYRNELEQVLSVLEPRRAAERLATEAMAELEASGAAVVGADDRTTASAGTWPVSAEVRLPIPGRKRDRAALLVWPAFGRSAA